MENFPKTELLKLVHAGMSESRSGFALAVGRFATKLKRLDPDLAQAVSAHVSAQSVLRSGSAAAAPVPVDADTRMQLVDVVNPVRLVREPILSESVRVTLESVLSEWKHLDILLREGLAPARTLLFCGQPGVGKTLAAHWLAAELGLPLLTLNLATVMSSFLGKTGNNVKAVFDHAVIAPCVLLLDEFDAIAKRRDDDTDVGELKRLVNVLLQAMDDWPATSLLVAATNHGDLLDPAVWRRFDHVLNFEPPHMELIAEYLSELELPAATVSSLASLLRGETFSSIHQLVQSARKGALLENQPLAKVVIKLALKSKSAQANGAKEHDAEMVLMHLEGKSLREIAGHFGKSHPTVGNVIKRYLGD